MEFNSMKMGFNEIDVQRIQNEIVNAQNKKQKTGKQSR